MSAKSIIKRFDKLKGSEHYTNNATLAQDVASLFIPRRSDITTTKTTGTESGWYDHIYEPAPISTAQILATGQFDLLFTGKWFEGQPPQMVPTDEQWRAYGLVGERMMAKIEGSNFKLEAQEFLLDRSTVHTSLMMIDDEDGTPVFLQVPYGRYVVEENHKKYVDTVYREFKLTARQAEQKFSLPDDSMGKMLMDALNDEARADDLFTFIHCIQPRRVRKAGSPNKKDKPWKSMYVCKEDENVVREGGYDEQPFVVSRYDRWGESPYGTGPAHIELTRARALQKMKQTWLALGDRITSPGIFVAPDQEQAPDPFGVTVVSWESAAAGLPREWRTQGDYNVSLDAIEQEIRKMEAVFNVPLFMLLTSPSEQTREKTAYEVSKMLEEQVARASPTFSRLNEEVIEVLLARVFGIMLRNGDFDDIVENLVATDEEGNVIGIEQPKINFTSKLAMAMKAVESNSVVQFFQEMGYVFEVKPETMDNFDMDEIATRSWKNKGLPAEGLLTGKEVEGIRQQRAELAQAQAAMEAGQQASQIAKNTQGL